jgi:hypothetical protein
VGVCVSGSLAHPGRLLLIYAHPSVNSTLFYWFWFSVSDGYHCGKHEVLEFPVDLTSVNTGRREILTEQATLLMQDLKRHSYRRVRNQKTTNVVYDEFYPSVSKPIVDEIDRVLAQHYGFTDEELDFIINYDIKYRMGKDADDGE